MMATYDEPVIRWPFGLTSSTNDIHFQDFLGGSSNVQTISSAPKYINKGETATLGPTDFVDAIETAFNAAAIALGLSSTWSVALVPDTLKMLVSQLSGTTFDRLEIDFGHVNTTIDPYLMGYNNSTAVVIFSGTTTSTYQLGNQWAPGIYAVFDSAEQQKTITYEHRNLNGRPVRVNHNQTAWVERLLDFSTPGVAAARMLDGRASLASYATVGEVELNEPNTWENLKRYLVGSPGPYDDHRVYLYSTSDPSTHTQDGAYEYILSDSKPGLEGVDLGDYVAERSSEYYPARVVLWGES